MNILLGVSGSVSACLVPKLVKGLQALGEVQVVFTKSGCELLAAAHRPEGHFPPTMDCKVWFDHDEWQGADGHPWDTGDRILHTDLKNWADILVVAPCSANTLAKIANGLCDNLLTCVVRAWPAHKPFLLAPAMNVDMWESPITKRHLRQLMEDCPDSFMDCVHPQSKELACGDVGFGALADVAAIVKTVGSIATWDFPVAQQTKGRFVPTAGHPGSFGHARKHDTHTGVDLYTKYGTQVHAVEAGVVVDVIPFTGKNAIGEDGKPMDWWRDTQAVLVKGASGIVVYGEIQAQTRKGFALAKGAVLGYIMDVLPKEKLRPDIPHHSTSMLHIELYTTEAAAQNFKWRTWKLGEPQPEGLLDPTPFLLASS